MGKRTFLHRAFIAGIVLKGVDSVLQIIGGISLFLISPQSLNTLVLSPSSHELSEDPGGLRGPLPGALGTGLVGKLAALRAAFYLFSHGVAKLETVVVLLKGKIWAYHAGILFFLLFISLSVCTATATRIRHGLSF